MFLQLAGEGLGTRSEAARAARRRRCGPARSDEGGGRGRGRDGDGRGGGVCGRFGDGGGEEDGAGGES